MEERIDFEAHFSITSKTQNRLEKHGCVRTLVL